MTLDELLAEAAARGASDIHLRAGDPPFVRIGGQLEQWTSLPASTAEHLEQTAARVLSPQQAARLKSAKHLDASWHAQGVGRVRANIFHQRGTVAISLRLIPDQVPSIETLGIPESVQKIALETRGLVLVTGVTGSGKSTTLAALIDLINRTRPLHILTLEDPIEFMHTNALAVVTQREIGIDVPNYAGGIRAALRQDPDVILIGEMRGPATMKAALTAASTGHLVFSTLHTTDAAETINRIITSFPTDYQGSVREQLAGALRASISQRLLPRADAAGLALATEVLINTPFIRDCITKGEKAAVISDAIAMGGPGSGMQSFDQSIIGLVNAGMVSGEEALHWVTNVEEFKMQLRGITRGSNMGGPQLETPMQTYSIKDAITRRVG